WRFGGHHVSLNHVIDRGRLVSATPCFIGADPARSPLLGGGELAPLHAVESTARTLVLSMSEDQLRQAMLHASAPSDIISGNRARLGSQAEMLHMNDARLWGHLLDDPRMREIAEVIDQTVESASGYQAAD